MSSFSGETPKRTWASISSSPLFIKVALSTEILAPIDQLGWRIACSGVTAAMRSADQVRNGPPEAVKVIFSIAWLWAKSSNWNAALCSESTGISTPRESAAARRKTSPAATTHSLLASATIAPRFAASSVGAKPAAPTIALTTISEGRCAASITASVPASTSTPVPVSSSASSRFRDASPITATLGRNSRACAARSATFFCAVNACSGNACGP